MSASRGGKICGGASLLSAADIEDVEALCGELASPKPKDTRNQDLSNAIDRGSGDRCWNPREDLHIAPISAVDFPAIGESVTLRLARHPSLGAVSPNHADHHADGESKLVSSPAVSTSGYSEDTENTRKNFEQSARFEIEGQRNTLTTETTCKDKWHGIDDEEGFATVVVSCWQKQLQHHLVSFNQVRSLASELGGELLRLTPPLDDPSLLLASSPLAPSSTCALWSVMEAEVGEAESKIAALRSEVEEFPLQAVGIVDEVSEQVSIFEGELEGQRRRSLRLGAEVEMIASEFGESQVRQRSLQLQAQAAVAALRTERARYTHRERLAVSEASARASAEVGDTVVELVSRLDASEHSRAELAAEVVAERHKFRMLAADMEAQAAEQVVAARRAGWEDAKTTREALEERVGELASELLYSKGCVVAQVAAARHDARREGELAREALQAHVREFEEELTDIQAYLPTEVAAARQDGATASEKALQAQMIHLAQELEDARASTAAEVAGAREKGRQDADLAHRALQGAPAALEELRWVHPAEVVGASTWQQSGGRCRAYRAVLLR